MTIHIRPLEPDDLHDLASLWNRTVSADPINEHRLLIDYILDPNFDPRALLVAADDDLLVGFVLGMASRPGQPSENAPATGVIVGFGVDAKHRRRGIGSRLLEHLETLWREQDVKSIQVGPWIPTYLTPGVDEAAYPGAVEFLSANGYQAGGKPVSMRALLTGYVPAADVEPVSDKLIASGVEIRPATSADAIPLLAFAVQHFPHWESYVRGNLRSVVTASDTSTLHIAIGGEGIIGFALTNGERFGPFGVDESRRGQGVGAVLLSRALCAMRAQNFHAAYFLWTSDQTARLYGRHGFEIVRRFTMIRKNL